MQYPDTYVLHSEGHASWWAGLGCAHVYEIFLAKPEISNCYKKGKLKHHDIVPELSFIMHSLILLGLSGFLVARWTSASELNNYNSLADYEIKIFT